MPNRTTHFTPLSSTLLFHPLSPFRERKVTKFFALSSPLTALPAEGRQSYGLFGTYKSLLSKTPFALKGAQRYETFRFVKSLSLSSTHFLKGQQGYKVILTFTSAALSHHSLTHLSKTMPDLTTTLCPAILHPLLPLLFFRECKITKFLPCQAPSHSPPARYGKVTKF